MRDGRRGPALFRPGRSRIARRGVAPTHLARQLVERLANPVQHLVPASREPVDPRGFGPLGFCGSKPASRGHPRQHRIQRAGTQAIAVMLKLLEHPLSVDALLASMMKDMDLPEGKEELADNGIAHGPIIIAPRIRNRWSITQLCWQACLVSRAGVAANSVSPPPLFVFTQLVTRTAWQRTRGHTGPRATSRFQV
jgi:hypothetical protein